MTRLLLSLAVAGGLLSAQTRPDGLLNAKNRGRLYPVGSYELPKSDAELKTMAEAGFNLFRCGSRADLDRVAAVGAQGWIPLSLQAGSDGGKLRARVDELKSHPALAAWEGPDEIVWNFTAYSGLFRQGTHKVKDEWWTQSPNAVDYANKEGSKIMSQLVEGIRVVRQADSARPVWINEAARSDLKFIREYLDDIDYTGCDTYPIHAATRKPMAVAEFTERYLKVGRRRPVWMVLQGFAWGGLDGINEAEVYPTFAETRAMAWAAIVDGAKGVLYWGMDAAPPKPAFRESLHAIAAELAALQTFLVAPDAPGVRVESIDSENFEAPPSRGVRMMARRAASGELLLVLLNEDDRPHMGVVVSGLSAAARPLEELYGAERAVPKRGEFVTRLLPYQVKIFAPSRRWESQKYREGRAFIAP
jgi:hypothetical protein